MADILKISTPLVDKNPIQPTRPADPNVPFQLSDITKVVQPGQGSEILKQNSGMIQKETTPSILMDLLKDPSVTVGFLKNIFMLQEIFNLLPANNIALTQEIQQLFQALLVKPDEIVAELTRQEFASTSFKGELFSFLRGLLAQTPKVELRYGIANLLKALNGRFSRQDILRSVSNSLLFLSENLQASKGLSQRLAELSARFASPNAQREYPQLKSDALALFREVEGSILYTPKLQKVLPLVIYNLSRFSDNPDFLREAVGGLLTLVDGGEQKEKLVTLLHEYIEARESGRRFDSQTRQALDKLLGTVGGEEPVQTDRSMRQMLEKLLGTQAEDEPVPASQNMRQMLEKLLSAHAEGKSVQPEQNARQILEQMLDEQDSQTTRGTLEKLLGKQSENGAEQSGKTTRELLERLLRAEDNGKLAPGTSARMLLETAAEKENSRVMEVLTRIIAKQSGNEEIRLLSADKIDKIVHSLLSSPCNFTPLLHFIIPVQDGDVRAFAELWIDPNGEDETESGASAEENIHMLIVFDVDGIGRFETELLVVGKNMKLNLYCPPAYVAAFRNIGTDVARVVSNTKYRLSDVTVAKLERQRSLMDVFKNLPHRRVGVDVKI